MASGYLPITAGTPGIAADVTDYWSKQVPMTFASSAARDSALSAVLREGMRAYALDTNILTMYDGSAWQEYGRNAARATWVPVINQSANPTFTTARATYCKRFREVHYDFDLAVTSAGTAGTDISVTLPFTAPAAMVGGVIGQGWIYDASADDVFSFHLTVTSTTNCKLQQFTVGPTLAITYIGNGVTLTLASGDVIRGSATYEAAA